MNTEILIQTYRLFDILSGILETNERMRVDLLAIRQQQIESRKKSFYERLLLIIGAFATAISALNEYLKDSVSSKYITISILAIIFFIYLTISFLNFVSENKNAKIIDSEIGMSKKQPAEESTRFLLILASTYGTRRSLAKSIVESSDSDEPTRKKFSTHAKHWQSKIDNLKRHTKNLHDTGAIDYTSYTRIIDWLDAPNSWNKDKEGD